MYHLNNKQVMKKFQKNDKLHRGDVVIIKVTLKDKEYGRENKGSSL